MMNAVFGAVSDMIEQGQREGVFGDVDPLMTHLTIMPPILIFFARQRVWPPRAASIGLLEPRQLDAFVAHMQRTALRLVTRKDRHPGATCSRAARQLVARLKGSILVIDSGRHAQADVAGPAAASALAGALGVAASRASPRPRTRCAPRATSRPPR